jgi:hypothetical protein
VDKNSFQSRFTHIYLPITAVAILLSIRFIEGAYWRGDNHLIFTLNPWREFRSSFSIWDIRHDMGGTRVSYLPLQYAVMASIRALGIGLALAQQIWICFLLLIGGIGSARLSIALRPTEKLMSFVAGLVFMTSPFVVGFLSPTWLFVYTVICPWLLTAIIEASRGNSIWRWSAVIGLAFVFAGNNNVPALTYSLIPAVCWAAFLLISSSSSRKNLLKLSWRTLVLLIPLVTPSILRLLATKNALGANLASSETITAIAQSSSWSESWRGFGSWLLYWNPSGRLLVPYFKPYATSPWIILATAALPVIALAAIGIVRSWERLLLAAIAILSVALMVGGYPRSGSTLFGQLWVHLINDSEFIFAMRNSYKAGSALLTVTSLLVALLFAELWKKYRDNKFAVTAGSFIFIIILLTSSSALWTGAFYRTDNSFRTSAVPSYWYESMDWLSKQEGSGSFLIVPPSESVPYVWGSISGGDIFPSIATQPFLLSSFFTEGAVDSRGTVRWLSEWLARPSYKPGDLSPIANRIGLRWVIIRNDLTEGSSQIPSTLIYDKLRNDPSVQMVSHFGPNNSLGFPAIEILQVGNPAPAKVVPLTPPLIVSGDAEAWGQLSRAGYLNGDKPFQFSGTMTSLDLVSAIESGSSVVITDTNRRVSSSFGATGETLSKFQTYRVYDRFASIESQSIATFGDARSITDNSPSALVDLGPKYDVSMAFDDDDSTSWLTGSYAQQTFPYSLNIVLNQPQQLKSFEFIGSSEVDQRRPQEISVILSDGRYFRSNFVDNHAIIILPDGVSSDAFSIVITQLKDSGSAPFGLAEVNITVSDGSELDLARQIRMPHDIFEAVEGNKLALESLAKVDLEFTMEKLRNWKSDLETSLTRSFEVPSDRTFDLRGWIDLPSYITDDQLSHLISSSTTVTGSSRYEDDIRYSAAWAIDENASSAWEPALNEEPVLKFNNENGTVSKIALVIKQPSISSLAYPFIKIRANNRVVDRIDLRTDGCRDDKVCEIELSLINKAITGKFEIVFPALIEPLSSNWSIGEVVINDRQLQERGCIDDLLSIDGENLPIRLIEGIDKQNGPFEFEGCKTLTLKNGSHVLRTSNKTVVDFVSLKSKQSPENQDSSTIASKVITSSPSKLTVLSTGPAWVLVPRGFNDFWQARVGGVAIPVQQLDAQTAVKIPSAGEFELTVSHKWDLRYRIASIFSMIMAFICIAVTIWPRHKFRAISTDENFEIQLSLAAPLAALGSVMGIILVGNLAGWITSIVFISIWWKFNLTPKVAVFTAAICLTCAGIFAIPPFGPKLTEVTPAWPIFRESSNTLAQQASVMILTALFCWSIESWKNRHQKTLPNSSIEQPDSDR